MPAVNTLTWSVGNTLQWTTTTTRHIWIEGLREPCLEIQTRIVLRFIAGLHLLVHQHWKMSASWDTYVTRTASVINELMHHPDTDTMLRSNSFSSHDEKTKLFLPMGYITSHPQHPQWYSTWTMPYTSRHILIQTSRLFCPWLPQIWGLHTLRASYETHPTVGLDLDSLALDIVVEWSSRHAVHDATQSPLLAWVASVTNIKYHKQCRVLSETGHLLALSGDIPSG